MSTPNARTTGPSIPGLREGQIDVHGVPVAYHEVGEGAPLLCVHGNFASKRWFTEQLRQPPTGWRVIALDLPNFGASGELGGTISIRAYAQMLDTFVRTLGLPRFVLLGHSLGGAVAQLFAAEAPDTLRGLVLVDSAAPSGLKTPEERYRGLELLRNNRPLMTQALSPAIGQRLPAYLDALIDDALAMRPPAFVGNARALEKHNVINALRQVRCPVLVVRGTSDYLITQEMADATVAAFPNARLELFPNVGHSPQLEAPDAFNTLLGEFLKTLP